MRFKRERLSEDEILELYSCTAEFGGAFEVEEGRECTMDEVELEIKRWLESDKLTVGRS